MDLATRTPENDEGRWLAMFTNAGGCVSEKHWHEAAFIFAECRDSLEREFAMEEKALFLTGENAIGSRGVTALMREEHHSIRKVLALLSRALSTHDAGDFIKQSATLDTMLRQHSEKKESIRYLMAQHTWVD